MSPQDEIIRGERARQILEDPLVVEALSGIKSQLLEQWRLSPVKDTELRERIWAIYNGMHVFIDAFESHIATGKFALATEQQRG